MQWLWWPISERNNRNEAPKFPLQDESELSCLLCATMNQTIIIEHDFKCLVSSMVHTIFPYEIPRHDLWCEKGTTTIRLKVIIWHTNVVVVSTFVPLIGTNKCVNTWSSVFLCDSLKISRWWDMKTLTCLLCVSDKMTFSLFSMGSLTKAGLNFICCVSEDTISSLWRWGNP